MSPPPERIKSAYLVLSVFAFLVILRLSVLEPQSDLSPEQVNSNSDEIVGENLALEAINPIDLKKYQTCLSDEGSTDLVRLTVALVVVESFARPRWQRRLEIDVSKMWLLLAGRLPNLSLGIAQVRVSTARRLLADTHTPTNSDRELLGLLANDCSCIRLAHQYVVSLSQSHSCQWNNPISQQLLGQLGLASLTEDRTLEILRTHFGWKGGMHDQWLDWTACGRLIARDYNGQSANRALGRGFWERLYENMAESVFEKLRPKTPSQSVTK